MPVVINGDTGITQSGEFDSDSSFGYKNRLINGGMVFDQRNAGAAVTSANGFITDRWSLGKYDPTGGSYTGQQVSDAPAGFNYSLKVTVTSSVVQSADQFWQAFQTIEGYNVADFGFGTSSPKQVTLSFWVKSSVTGTYSVAFFNNGVGSTDRAYVTTYTVNSANTWEQKTITITGDGSSGSGYWGTTNNAGLGVYFDLGCGTNQEATANTWVTGNERRVAGTVRLMATNSATWQITGVQLEKGSTATSFDFRSYGTELQLAQRYFQKTYNIEVAIGTASGSGPAITRASASTQTFLVELQRFMQVSMRATPTVTAYSSNTGASGKVHVSGSDVTVTSINDAGTYSFGYPLITSTPSAGNDCRCHYVASAEL